MTRRVGRYRLLGELGAGGASVVYLAIAEAPFGFNKLVVLKMLRAELAEDDALASMFVEEARLAARIQHANVVQTQEVIDDGGQLYIVMEYLEGQPFNIAQRALGNGKRLGTAIRLRILSEALRGLDHAHEVKDWSGASLALVHRDISPHNVFVCFDGAVKILDFGIATFATRAARTETGVVKGKFRYMAPEQLLGGRVDRRADLFAVGVMIWEVLAGYSMWGRLTDAQVMSCLVNGTIPPITNHADVPPAALALCAKALAFDPGERFATAAELKQALDLAIEEIAPGVSSADIAPAMDELFADSRARRRARVAAQIAAPADPARADSLRRSPDGSTDGSHPGLSLGISAVSSRTRSALWAGVTGAVALASVAGAIAISARPETATRSRVAAEVVGARASAEVARPRSAESDPRPSVPPTSLARSHVSAAPLPPSKPDEVVIAPKVLVAATPNVPRAGKEKREGFRRDF